MIGRYDTNAAGAGTGFTGMWGVYPFADSGVVYGSDRDNGLHLFQIDVGHLNRYGQGTPPAGRPAPRAVQERATPRVGASGFELHVSGLTAGARFALFLSTGAGSTQVFGIELLLDTNLLIGIDGTADANGRAVVPLPIPSNANLARARIYAQVVAVDAGGPRGLIASRGMWFGIAP